MKHHSRNKHKQSNLVETVCNKMQKFQIVFVVGCVMFGGAYFWQVNSLATRGYKIRDLEQSIQELKRSTQQLQIKAAEEQSLDKVTEKIKQLNMVAPTKFEYLRQISKDVALR